MDINSPEFQKAILDVIDIRIEKKFKELIKSDLILEKVGKVAVSSNGSMIQVYINNSQTAVEVKNPRSFSLSVGDFVAVVFPTFKNDNSKYIDRVL